MIWGWVLIVASLLVQVAGHEAAHALAMRQRGVPIVEAGIGFFKPRLAVRWRGVLWTLSPWLLGAYVQPSGEDSRAIKNGPYRPMAEIYGSGPLFNLGLGLAAWMSYAILNDLWLIGVMTGIVLVVLIARWEQIAAYLVPAIAPLLGVWFLWVSVTMMAHGAVTGLTGLGQFAGEVTSVDGLLVFNAFVGFALFILNSAPLGLNDGGWVWWRILHDRFGHKAADRYLIVAVGALGVVIGYALIRDLINIVI